MVFALAGDSTTTSVFATIRFPCSSAPRRGRTAGGRTPSARDGTTDPRPQRDSRPSATPTSRLDLAAVIALGVAGTMIGSWLAWAVGYLGGRPLVERFGRYLLLRPHEIDRAHAWFERHGEATVCFARLIPLVRAFIS